MNTEWLIRRVAGELLDDAKYQVDRNKGSIPNALARTARSAPENLMRAVGANW